MLIRVEAGIKGGEPVAHPVAKEAKSSRIRPDGGHVGRKSRLV